MWQATTSQMMLNDGLLEIVASCIADHLKLCKVYQYQCNTVNGKCHMVLLKSNVTHSRVYIFSTYIHVHIGAH